jgi:glycosyltransferase involved in cell wall biosynthesis
MKILWLASWYPDDLEPTNGDFIQRFANAVADCIDITILHIAQKDSSISTHQYKQTRRTGKKGFEQICYFNYKPTGIGWLDKIRFNSIYLQYGKNLLKQYIAQNGKPDLIHVHVPMKMGMLALYAKQKWKIPYIVSEQASSYEDNAIDGYYTRSAFYKKNTTKIFQQANAVTNVSATIGQKLQHLFNIEKVHTIHNCVHTNLFFYAPNKVLASFTFIHVSSFLPQKNTVGLLRAFKLLMSKNKQFHLLLVGPLNSLVLSTINELKLQQNITTTGNAAYPFVAAYMQQAHAFVLFSNQENFPCVVVEALCCGLPVITSRVGGVAEAITKENGMVIEKNNEQQLAIAMQTMAENYHNYNRASIAANAAFLYNYNTIATQFLNIYADVLQ